MGKKRRLPPRTRDLDTDAGPDEFADSRGDRDGDRRDARPVSGRYLRPRLGEPIAIALSGGVVVLLLWYSFGWVLQHDEVGVVTGKLLGYMLLLGAYAVYGLYATMYLAVRWRTLVIGKDRLQLLAPGGRVIGQLPYSNIAIVEVGQHLAAHSERVEIILRKRRHRGTWWPRMNHLDAEYDVTLVGSYEVDATHVRLLLTDALAKGGYGYR